MSRGYTILLFLSFMSSIVMGQNEKASKRVYRKAQRELKKIERTKRKEASGFSKIILPSVYYTPETRLAGGIAGIGYISNPNDSTVKTSKLIVAAIYTQNDQVILSGKGEFFLDKNDYFLAVQTGYFKYPYQFSGIGNSHSVDINEKYDSDFPRLGIQFTKRTREKLYLGLRYFYQNTSITKTVENGILENANVFGKQGGVVSGIGVSGTYDSRNFQLSPTNGWFATFYSQHDRKGTGSDFNFDSYVADVRRYLPFLKNHVLAFQFYNEFHFGRLPFNRIALLGGKERMRGYTEGVYRDLKMSVTQLEYRSRIYFNRIGFVLFGGVGSVGAAINDLGKKVHYSTGAGLRIALDPKNRVFIRIDVGIGDGVSGFYFDLGEAF